MKNTMLSLLGTSILAVASAHAELTIPGTSCWQTSTGGMPVIQNGALHNYSTDQTLVVGCPTSPITTHSKLKATFINNSSFMICSAYKKTAFSRPNQVSAYTSGTNGVVTVKTTGNIGLLVVGPQPDSISCTLPPQTALVSVGYTN